MACPNCLLELDGSRQSQEAFTRNQEGQRVPPWVTAPAGSLTPALRIFSWFPIAVSDLLEVISQGSGGPPPSEHSHPLIDAVFFSFLSFVRAVKPGLPSFSEPLPVILPRGAHQPCLPSLRLLLLTNDFISLAVPQRCSVLNIMGGDSFHTFICNCAHCACWSHGEHLWFLFTTATDRLPVGNFSFI